MHFVGLSEKMDVHRESLGSTRHLKLATFFLKLGFYSVTQAGPKLTAILLPLSRLTAGIAVHTTSPGSLTSVIADTLYLILIFDERLSKISYNFLGTKEQPHHG